MSNPLGLCAYGVPYLMGHAGRGTPLENPAPWPLASLPSRVAELGLGAVELPAHVLVEQAGAAALTRLRDECRDLGLTVVQAGRRVSTVADEFPLAEAIGARVVRCTLSGILCGDRREVGLDGFEAILTEAIDVLRKVAPEAESRGLKIAVENHQDASSADLVRLCREVDRPTVGLTLDTGNPLAVAEDPLAFAEAILPWLNNVHLKDYLLCATPSGTRLVHTAIGHGVVDFKRLRTLFASRPEVVCGIEMAALGERHVAWLERDWWACHQPRQAADLVGFLRLQQAAENHSDWPTPFDRGEADGLAAWEEHRLHQSVAAMQAIWKESA